MVFSVVMYECESWTVRKAEHRRIDAFELCCWKRLKSPSDCKAIQPVHSEGDQPWVFIARNDSEAETPILWPPHVNSWLIGKDPDTGGEGDDRGWDGWMASQLNEHEFEWTPGVGDGQRGLACCDSWGHKESDATERLNWTELNGRNKFKKREREKCTAWWL